MPNNPRNILNKNLRRMEKKNLTEESVNKQIKNLCLMSRPADENALDDWKKRNQEHYKEVMDIAKENGILITLTDEQKTDLKAVGVEIQPTVLETLSDYGSHYAGRLGHATLTALSFGHILSKNTAKSSTQNTVETTYTLSPDILESLSKTDTEIITKDWTEDWTDALPDVVPLNVSDTNESGPVTSKINTQTIKKAFNRIKEQHAKKSSQTSEETLPKKLNDLMDKFRQMKTVDHHDIQQDSLTNMNKGRTILYNDIVQFANENKIVLEDIPATELKKLGINHPESLKKSFIEEVPSSSGRTMTEAAQTLLAEAKTATQNKIIAFTQNAISVLTEKGAETTEWLILGMLQSLSKLDEIHNAIIHGTFTFPTPSKTDIHSEDEDQSDRSEHDVEENGISNVLQQRDTDSNSADDEVEVNEALNNLQQPDTEQEADSGLEFEFEFDFDDQSDRSEDNNVEENEVSDVLQRQQDDDPLRSEQVERIARLNNLKHVFDNLLLALTTANSAFNDPRIVTLYNLMSSNGTVLFLELEANSSEAATTQIQSIETLLKNAEQSFQYETEWYKMPLNVIRPILDALWALVGLVAQMLPAALFDNQEDFVAKCNEKQKPNASKAFESSGVKCRFFGGERDSNQKGFKESITEEIATISGANNA